MILIEPVTWNPKAQQSLEASKRFLSKLKVDQLARAIDSEDSSVADLLSEIDKFCASMRAVSSNTELASAAAQQLKICDSLIRRAKKKESQDTLSTFLKQKLSAAIARLEDIKTGIRNVRRNSMISENLTNGGKSPMAERSESHIEMKDFRESHRKVEVIVPDRRNSVLNETEDQEWNKLITGQPSPNLTKSDRKLVKQNTCPDDKLLDFCKDASKTKKAIETEFSKRICFKESDLASSDKKPRDNRVFKNSNSRPKIIRKYGDF